MPVVALARPRTAVSVVLLVSLVSLVSGLLPDAGLAAVTATAVTTPAPDAPLRVSIDVSPGATASPLAVSGTATTGDPADRLDLLCYRWDAGTAAPATTVVASSVEPAAGGAWSATIPDLAVLPATAPCRLLAVPAGTTPGELAAFSGPWLFVSRSRIERFVGGANADKAKGWSVTVVQSGGSATYGPLGECSLCRSRTASGPTLELSDELFTAAAALGAPASLAPARSAALLVDGKPAYDPATASKLPGAGTLAGFEPVTVTVTRDAASGDATIVEQLELVRCAGDVSPCSAFVRAGVNWKRTFVHRGGRAVRITDELVSSDGLAHELDAWLRHSTAWTAPAAGLLLPWVAGATFQAYSAHAELPLPPAGPYTVYVRGKRDAPDLSTQYAGGSVTAAVAPDAMRMSGVTHGEEHHAHVVRAVPKTGAVRLDHGVAWDSARAEVDAAARAYEDVFAGPVITVTSPTAGSTVLVRPLTVTGAVRDTGTVASLTVNGLRVTPNADGTWTARLSLVDGLRRITVLATDSVGNTTRASFRVRVTALRIYGTNRKEKITGTDNPNAIFGLGGDDRILASGGNDRVNGGDGADRIDLGSGHDTARGMSGNDVVDCGNGARSHRDRLEGNAGNDLLRCPDGRGGDTLVGGAGRDICIGDRGDVFRSCERTRIA